MKELYGNGYVPSIAQAIEEMKAEQGESFSPERINLAELERRKLRMVSLMMLIVAIIFLVAFYIFWTSSLPYSSVMWSLHILYG